MSWGNGPCVLYYLLHEGVIVYIGVSQNLRRRMPMHKDKVFDEVKTLPFQTRVAANDQERIEIIKHRPKYNTVYLFALFGRNLDQKREINLR
jgi:predicted GIY-YIG superfamily endonuclease